MKKIAIIFIIIGILFSSPTKALESNFYINLEVISIRSTLLHDLLFKPIPVLVMTIDFNRTIYKVTNLLISTENKTIGKLGPTIEILEWRGEYHPSIILYQMPIGRIMIEHLKLKGD